MISIFSSGDNRLIKFIRYERFEHLIAADVEIISKCLENPARTCPDGAII
jgi:hypothetical protein